VPSHYAFRLLNRYLQHTTQSSQIKPKDNWSRIVGQHRSGLRADSTLLPRASARAIVALHSSEVGNRQPPGEDLSVKVPPQSPSFSPAAA